MLQSKNNNQTYHPKHALDHFKKRIHPSELIIACCFFFLSLGKWFNLPLSMSISCAVALLSCGMGVWGALAGSMISCFYQWLWGIYPFWWTVIVIACLPLLHGIKWKRKSYLILSCAAFTIPGVILFGFQQNFTVQEWILSVFQIIGCSVTVPAIVKGIRWLKTRERSDSSTDDALCLMIPLLAVISGMTTIHLWHVNFGYVFAIATLLLASRILSVAVSSSIGFCIGLTLLLSGHGTFWCIYLSFAGMINSWAKLSNRLFGAFLSTAGVIFASYLLSGSLWKAALYSCIIGTVLYILLPEKYIRKATLLLQNTSLFQRSDNPYLEDRLHSLTKTLRKLSFALPEINVNTAKTCNAGEELMETLCDGCENMMICWHDTFDQRKKEFQELEMNLLNTGEITNVPQSCCRVQLAEKTMKNMLKREQERLLQRKRVRFEQEMLNTHFSALSKIVDESIQEGITGAEEDAYLVRQVNEVLKITRFPAHALFVKAEHGHYRIGLQKHYSFHAGHHLDMILKHIGNRLQRDLKISCEEGYRLLIDEIPPYQISVGKATACAISAERKSITPYAVENGDAVIHQSIKNGISLVALSDGMGHGEGAGRESEKTLELLSICLEAGYTRMQAMTTVNGIMLSSTGGERFATVDLCMFDLWNGHMTINKLGAAHSLIVQGQHVRLIEGEALPLGIVEYITPMEYTMHLAEGDMVLLFSDGITDAFDGEQSLSVLIRRYLKLTPQQIADSILQDALIQSGGLPEDDMTVVCIRLENRKKNQYAKRSA